MMKIFKNMEEMKPYYNEKTNTYEFIENGNLIDVKIDFDLNIECNIKSRDIKAKDIQACNIKSRDINAWNIKACDINACDINACDINARDIKACDINADDIIARDIKAWNIKARDINAAWDIRASRDIQAEDINANNIRYNSVCYARSKFVCNSIKGKRPNSKHFCLDSEIVISNKK